MRFGLRKLFDLRKRKMKKRKKKKEKGIVEWMYKLRFIRACLKAETRYARYKGYSRNLTWQKVSRILT